MVERRTFKTRKRALRAKKSWFVKEDSYDAVNICPDETGIWDFLSLANINSEILSLWPMAGQKNDNFLLLHLNLSFTNSTCLYLKPTRTCLTNSKLLASCSFSNWFGVLPLKPFFPIHSWPFMMMNQDKNISIMIINPAPWDFDYCHYLD